MKRGRGGERMRVSDLCDDQVFPGSFLFRNVVWEMQVCH